MEASVSLLPCAFSQKTKESPATKFAQTVPQNSLAKEVDVDKIAAAVEMILEAIGEDPQRAGLVDTPQRVARLYQELCYSTGVDAASEITCKFQEETESLVVVKGIEFTSLCEHHLVPFLGVAHVAYLPSNGMITGLSKLARVVELTARRLQVQERMTEEIAAAIFEGIEAQGVCVVLEAEHMCMSMRGIKKAGARTVTSAFRGLFKTDKQSRAEVLSHLK
jgi:GTP cyclohydrolase I